MIDQELIYIILGILVLVAVVLGIYFFFNDIIDFFRNLGGSEEAPKMILSMIK